MDIAIWTFVTLDVKNVIVLGGLFLGNIRCQYLFKVGSASFLHSLLLYWTAVTESPIVLLLCSSVGQRLLLYSVQGMINSSITR